MNKQEKRYLAAMIVYALSMMSLAVAAILGGLKAASLTKKLAFIPIGFTIGLIFLTISTEMAVRFFKTKKYLLYWVEEKRPKSYFIWKKRHSNENRPIWFLIGSAAILPALTGVSAIFGWL